MNNIEQGGDVSGVQMVKLFFQGKWGGISLIGGAMVLVALAGVLYGFNANRAGEQAACMLGVAQSSKQFEELIRQYPKSASAPVALLALASAQFSAGAYDAAFGRYVEFTDKYPKHPMSGVAELGKIMCSEARGEIEKALIGFDAFTKAYPDHFLTPQALFGKARCLQAMGKYAEAKVIYEDFIAAHSESKWCQYAESALQTLNRQTRLASVPGRSDDQGK